MKCMSTSVLVNKHAQGAKSTLQMKILPNMFIIIIIIEILKTYNLKKLNKTHFLNKKS